MIDPRLFAEMAVEAEQSSKRIAALEASLSEANQEARRYCTERDALKARLEYCTERDVLKAKLDDTETSRLKEALHLAWGLVQWMSGSADFAPGGKSHGGWIKAQYDVDQIRHLVKATAPAQEVKG